MLTKKEETALDEIICQRGLYLDFLPFSETIGDHKRLLTEIRRLTNIIVNEKLNPKRTSQAGNAKRKI